MTNGANQINRRKFLKALGGSALGLSLAGTLSWRGAAQETIKIGGLFPLSGAVAREGAEVREGVELAVELINGEGGIGGEVQIELAFEDSKCTPDGGAAGARRLIDGGTDYVIGDFCSSSALAEQPILAAAGVAQLLFAFATSLTGTSRADSEANLSVRIGPQAKIEMAPLAKYAMLVNGNSKFFSIAQNSDFGRDMATEFEAVVKQLGGEVVATEFTQPFKPDFTPELTKAKASDADAILGIGLAFEEIQLGNQYNELELTQTFYGSDLLNDIAFIEAVGKTGNADGFFFPWVYDNGSNLRSFQRSEPEVGAAAMNGAFLSRRGRPATRNNGWGWGYVQLIKQAMEASIATDVETVMATVLSGVTFDLPLGSYGFLPCGQADMRAGVATYSQAQVLFVADRSFGDDVVTGLCA